VSRKQGGERKGNAEGRGVRKQRGAPVRATVRRTAMTKTCSERTAKNQECRREDGGQDPGIEPERNGSAAGAGKIDKTRCSG